ncbi:hypothetical protein AKJ16_DCAP05359 [Drosera capensis]
MGKLKVKAGRWFSILNSVVGESAISVRRQKNDDAEASSQPLLHKLEVLDLRIEGLLDSMLNVALMTGHLVPQGTSLKDADGIMGMNSFTLHMQNDGPFGALHAYTSLHTVEAFIVSLYSQPMISATTYVQQLQTKILRDFLLKTHGQQLHLKRRGHKLECSTEIWGVRLSASADKKVRGLCNFERASFFTIAEELQQLRKTCLNE